MSERTVISLVSNRYGTPVGRVVAEQNEYSYGITPAEYMDSNISIRVLSGSRFSAHDEYYESNTDGVINDAFDRLVIDGYFPGTKEIDVFSRYINIFHPNVPVVIHTVRTGYSQGDQVTLVAFVEPSNSAALPNERPYQTSTREHKECEDQIKIIGSITRNQFWSIEYQTISVDSVDMKNDSARILWDDDDTLNGILALEEFNPWTELRAEASQIIPTECVLSNTEYTL